VKETLKRYAERIDAASLRERVMIFLAATLVLAFLVNVALLEPLRAAQKRNLAESAQLREEMKPVQGQIATMAQSAARDLNAPNRAKLAELREQLAQLGTRVAQEQRRFTPPERMRGVLEEMLRRNRGLALLDLKTLPVMPVAVGGSAVPGHRNRLPARPAASIATASNSRSAAATPRFTTICAPSRTCPRSSTGRGPSWW